MKWIKNITRKIREIIFSIFSFVWGITDRFLYVLPILIILSWIGSFALIKTNWYRDNYFYVNCIDTLIFSISIIHAFFKAKNYLKVTRNCLKGMISIVVLQKAYYDFELSDYTYYFFYIFVMVMIVLKSIYDNLNNKI